MAGIDNKMQLSVAKVHLEAKAKTARTEWNKKKPTSMNVGEVLKIAKMELDASKRFYPNWVANNKKKLSTIETALIGKQSLWMFFVDVVSLFNSIGVKNIQLHRVFNALKFGVMMSQVQLKVACPKEEFFLDYLTQKKINLNDYDSIRVKSDDSFESVLEQIETDGKKKPGSFWIFVCEEFTNVTSNYELYKSAIEFEKATQKVVVK